MGKVYFGTPDGKMLGTIGEIKDIDLTPEESGIDDMFKGGSESFECEIEIKAKGGLDPFKYLMSGGDKGRYNGMVLKEDGYLSPENGWIR